MIFIGLFAIYLCEDHSTAVIVGIEYVICIVTVIFLIIVDGYDRKIRTAFLVAAGRGKGHLTHKTAEQTRHLISDEKSDQELNLYA